VEKSSRININIII